MHGRFRFCSRGRPVFVAAMAFGLVLSAGIPAAAADEFWKEFQRPGPAWRGKPFWSWNGVLEKEELLRQIHVMKAMGFGGFFMHSRTGLATEYLGDAWFGLINACADEAERLGLEAWLYDEDRWPSGTAGGMVTEDPKYRARFVSLRPVPAEKFSWDDRALAVFSCKLDGLSCSGCVRIRKDVPADLSPGKTVLVFTVEEMARSSFYNGFTDVDRLQREATDRFLQLTHEKYRARCGGRLGKSIRGIFTDEPHRQAVMTGFGISNENRLRMAPWTEKLPEAFQERFGYDIVEKLPELFLQPDGRAVSQVKWHYMELLQQLFLENWARPVLEWCRKNGMRFTGHVLHEDSLTSQAALQGSLLRFYECMDDPGVDVLTEGNRNYWIVQQLASAARQLGQKRLLSELYGCTGWQFNFESHKAVGDWQALFGINLRCPHLSWYTMEGEAKRDYPASILHQSAWWEDYDFVESYFARLGLVLAQGKPICDILVLSPVESVWCQIHAGWADGLSPKDPPVQELERAYAELFRWLAGAQIDFDSADEEMLGRLGKVERDPELGAILRVGKAPYRAVVVGRMATIRSSTMKLLENFRSATGKVVFAGDPPEHVDALPSPRAKSLASVSMRIPWERDRLVSQCRQVQRAQVEILEGRGRKAIDEIFCQLREEGRTRWLVAVNTSTSKGYEGAAIRVQGDGLVTELDCREGRRFSVPSEAAGGFVEFTADFPPSGERVFEIAPIREEGLETRPSRQVLRSERCRGPYEFRLAEPNVCVLDWARHRIQDGPWEKAAEILKVDQAVRRAFGLPVRSGEMVQPWYRAKTQPAPEKKGKVEIGFEFHADRVPAGEIHLALERPESFRVKLNGEAIDSSKPRGWWVDRAFQKVPVPSALLRQGPNEVALEVDFHEGINLEAVYLLGNFGVRLEGTKKVLVDLPQKLAAGDLASQGLPFYGGAISLKLPAAQKPAAGEKAFLGTPRFEAACLRVRSEGNPRRIIAWQPYEAEVTLDLAQQKPIELDVVLTRRNTFGPLHQVPLRAGAYGPGNFVTEGPGFSESYMLYPAGLLEEPEVRYTTAR